MDMPEHADSWETTDTVVMEKPRRADFERPEPADDEQFGSEVALLT